MGEEPTFRMSAAPDVVTKIQVFTERIGVPVKLNNLDTYAQEVLAEVIGFFRRPSSFSVISIVWNGCLADGAEAYFRRHEIKSEELKQEIESLKSELASAKAQAHHGFSLLFLVFPDIFIAFLRFKFHIPSLRMKTMTTSMQRT
jgi:hypothetical protein